MRDHRSTYLVFRVLALLVSITTIACFEKPISEDITIEFLADGTVMIGMELRLSEADELVKNPRVKERLSERRDAVQHGEDDWARSIRSLEPSRERITHELHEGNLVNVRRQSLIDDPERLPELFGFLPVGAFLDRDDDLLTLDLIPTGASRATARQERDVEENLQRFSSAVAAYLQAAAELYRYLEKSPDRARACFHELFGGEEQELDGRESLLLDALEERMVELTDVLSVPDGEAFTLDEKSQLVFNPFPGTIEITVAGEVTEVIGFDVKEVNRVTIPEIGFWSAFASLVGKWLDPNLVLLYVEATRRDEEGSLDIDGLAASPRHVVEPPGPGEVREALEERLIPPDVYRLRWRLPPSGTENAGG